MFWFVQFDAYLATITPLPNIPAWPRVIQLSAFTVSSIFEAETYMNIIKQCKCGSMKGVWIWQIYAEMLRSVLFKASFCGKTGMMSLSHITLVWVDFILIPQTSHQWVFWGSLCLHSHQLELCQPLIKGIDFYDYVRQLSTSPALHLQIKSS